MLDSCVLTLLPHVKVGSLYLPALNWLARHTILQRPPMESAKPNHLAIALLFSASTLYWISLYLYVPTLPSYVATRAPELASVGMVLAMYGLWQALLRIPVGVYVDFRGRSKLVIACGFLFSSAGALTMGYGRSVATLACGRALTGVAAATWVPLIAVFSGLFAVNQAVLATTLLTLSGSLGRLLATMSTGFLNNLGGYSLPFLVAAFSGLGACVITVSSPEKARKPRRPSLGSVLLLSKRRDVLVPTLMNAVTQVGNWAVTFGFLPVHAEQLGAGAVAKSLLISSSIAAVTLGNLLNTIVGRRVRRKTILLLSLITFSSGIALAAIAPVVAFLYVCAVLIGLANGFLYPILMGASIENVEQDQRSTAMGMHQSAYGIGMFLGPWLGGIVAGVLGIPLMFALTAAFCLVGGYLLLMQLASDQDRPE